MCDTNIMIMMKETVFEEALCVLFFFDYKEDFFCINERSHCYS